MTVDRNGLRPITIAIVAMGGEGGGVLAEWIVAVGDRAGYVAQNTSVAGVAQRTGATVYYVELHPPTDGPVPDGGRTAPVLSLFPTPGEVDIVIASELMEAGRAVQRGFCTPDRTVLIASTNRVYSIAERSALGDGRVDSAQLLEAAQQGSKRLVGADFLQLAERAGSVISASLFGALAGSAALPFAREDFEAAVRESGKAVEASLRAFSLGFDAAAAGSVTPRRTPVRVSIGRRPPEAVDAAGARERARDARALTDPGGLVGSALQARAARVAANFPEAARSMLLHGCVRTAVYQGPAYTDRYLDRVATLAQLDPDPDGKARLSVEAARHIALWMCYQDTIHVGLQKIRRKRIDEVRAEARAEPHQLLQVREFLHPQLDEITDTLPTRLGRHLAGSALFAAMVKTFTREGMVVNTTSITGYTMLRVMASMRPLRPRSLRFAREQEAIDAWLETARVAARRDPQLACEIVQCQQVLKGYGETHAHGRENFRALLDAALTLVGRPAAAETLERLRTAALADEDGTALARALADHDIELPAPA